MSLTEIILDAIKSNKITFGYKQSIKFIKSGKPKFIVIAENIPEPMRKQIEHNAKIFNLKVEIFKGTSKELGVTCGKPFPISTLVIEE
ncbi:MAG: 50S ribosomal protein L30e [Candidatus Aenigmarchaeota archaeon]|nr:50S ribosomal protein L30e [Candidatus Aenigmarchaeota archaeon]